MLTTSRQDIASAMTTLLWVKHYLICNRAFSSGNDGVNESGRLGRIQLECGGGGRKEYPPLLRLRGPKQHASPTRASGGGADE